MRAAKYTHTQTLPFSCVPARVRFGSKDITYIYINAHVLMASVNTHTHRHQALICILQMGIWMKRIE